MCLVLVAVSELITKCASTHSSAKASKNRLQVVQLIGASYIAFIQFKFFSKCLLSCHNVPGPGLDIWDTMIK